MVRVSFAWRGNNEPDVLGLAARRGCAVLKVWHVRPRSVKGFDSTTVRVKKDRGVCCGEGGGR